MINKYFFIKILFFIFVCAILGQSNIDINNVSTTESLNLFSSWKSKNLKVYLNDFVKAYRQMIFLDNLKKINQHNADPDNTYKMDLTQFSDMTQEEFSEQILTEILNNPPKQDKQLAEESDQDIDIKDITINPVKIKTAKTYSVDWRSKGAVTGVKNQGNCGSCWAFAATGVMESFNYIKNKSLKYFSEQQLVDCVNFQRGYSANGCNGGQAYEAIDYATKFGIQESYQYLYTGIKGQCKISSPTAGFYPIKYTTVEKTVSGLKSAIAKSPVTVNIDASNIAFYQKGIFNGCSPTPKLNHVVLVVGYDEDGNWIIKNSWGTSWGEQGYMTLKCGNNCGILQNIYKITS